MNPPVAPEQHGPAVWTGADMRDRSDWVWRLTDGEVDELLSATDSGRPLGNDLSSRLDALRSELIAGRGFELITGFPAAEVTRARCAAVFRLVGSRLGNERSQNAAGDLLGHVRNTGADPDADPTVRIYQTDRRQTFHTDSTDVVGLMCLETAQTGGESLLVSAGAVYNEVRRRDPDLAAALFEPVATDRRGEVPAGADPWFTIPVLSWHADRLTVLYQRQYIDSASRFADAPRLTDRQIAALDLFDEIANDPDVHLQMTFEVGDMQFVHNHSLLHDRAAFLDKPGRPRHLLRLWLSVPGDRPLPDVFAQRYGSTTVGDRGGIVISAATTSPS